jgi:hypothetical protein
MMKSHPKKSLKQSFKSVKVLEEYIDYIKSLITLSEWQQTRMLLPSGILYVPEPSQ